MIANTRTQFVLGGGVALVAFLVTPSLAHHSTAAFDNTRVIRIEGEVTQFRWINPHASFKVEGEADAAAGEGIILDVIR